MGFGKDGKGVIIYDSVVEGFGVLASLDAIIFTGRANGAMAEDFRMLRLDYWMSVIPSSGAFVLDGPVLVGIAHGALSAAQIEASLESIVVDQGSITPMEEANRPVFPLELFLIPELDVSDAATLVRKGSANIRWTFNNLDGWVWWAYNNSSDALITGSIFNVLAKAFGVWVT